jgi:trans-AT polyketide synthase/acyltransferase/oxidoreductase domain-containing protein
MRDPSNDERAFLPTIFMFSGQGSQYHQMGRDLFDEDPVFRGALERLDAAAVSVFGKSVLSLIYDTRRLKTEPFRETVPAHLAIVMVELALAETLAAHDIAPDFLLGASLGEFTAAVLSGALPVETCLRLLVEQGRVLDALCPPGGMLAVLASPELFDSTPLLRDRTDLAARNYDGHFVVAGSIEALVAAEELLRTRDIPFQRVSALHGFHSRLMDPAKSACRAILGKIAPERPRIPLISCARAGPIDAVTPQHLWMVAREPIEFARTIAGLEARGNYRYLDLGPAGTLHNFVRGNLAPGSRSCSFALLSPFAQDTRLLAKVTGMRHGSRAPATRITMQVYGFPGQGSQTRGMGKDLFDQFHEHTAEADAILGYSIRKLCLEDAENRLRLTQFTQPALYVVGCLSYLRRQKENSTPPAYLVGHSLGEYVALFAAGAFDFATGLRLVKKRGDLMSRADGGGMAAVMGCNLATVEATLADAGLKALDIANHNAPDQFVLAGPKAEIERARPLFEARQAHYVPLNVSAPFHSRYMAPAAEEFARFLAGVTFQAPAIPVIANVDARPYRPDEIGAKLVQQIARPVQWVDTIRYLMGKGDFSFEELGPGQVLTRLVTKIRQGATALKPREPEPAPAARRASGPSLRNGLGAPAFRERYGLRHGYLAGSMCHGISSKDMVVRLAESGAMGFFGTSDLSLREAENGLRAVLDALGPQAPFGANLLCQHARPDQEMALVDLLLELGVPTIEAAGFVTMTPALVKYRLKGGRIIAKVSRRDVAEQFLKPAPAPLVSRLLAQGHVTAAEAERVDDLLMADDLCAAAGCGWHSPVGSLATLLPAIVRLRDALAAGNQGRRVHVGAAGGIGTPEAAAAAFTLGADFIVTGSINQCTVEAATSPAVKDMLQQLDVHDVDYAPWSHMFELGERAQVVKRGVFFPARANNLFELWRQHDSFEAINPAKRAQIEEKYLGRPFAEAYADIRTRLLQTAPDEIMKADGSPRHRLTLVFRSYFENGFERALSGDEHHRLDYLVYCGSAMGAFNDWVKGTDLEPWRSRHVDVIANRLMAETARVLEKRNECSGGPATDRGGDRASRENLCASQADQEYG